MNNYFIYLLFLPWFLPALAEDAALADIFARQGMSGTMVISSLHTGKTFIHNDSRANQRYSTASTFKILNTLIALEEKVLADKNDLLKWDGTIHEYPDWNHDQTLESAFKVSCVWCYQEIARRVGAGKYRQYLQHSAYGTLREPFSETEFWLDGSLQISAMEQVDFLKRLYQRTLPFTPSSYEALSQIMLVEETPTYTIRAKTGWATRMAPQTGWYVGYVETAGDIWFFVMNIDIGSAKDLPLRQQLTRAALRAKGIIE